MASIAVQTLVWLCASYLPFFFPTTSDLDRSLINVVSTIKQGLHTFTLLNMASSSLPGEVAPLPKPNLPISQLESLKFKATQIIESITQLQRTIEANGHPAAMPSWPDILSKYNILLSQTHSFSNSLVNPFPVPGTSKQAPAQNLFTRIALHPSMGMLDAQLDGEVVPLLRNQQTTDVLRSENDTVRRLSEHMTTRGSLGVLGITPPAAPPGGFGAPRKPEYEDILRECAEIREAHDRRVERAVRAVTMLRDNFDWKQRVEVEVEEPEELDWDPRLGMQIGQTSDSGEGNAAVPEDADMESDDDEDDDEDENGDEDMGDADEGDGSDGEDEDDVEGALFGGMEDMSSPMTGAP